MSDGGGPVGHYQASQPATTEQTPDHESGETKPIVVWGGAAVILVALGAVFLASHPKAEKQPDKAATAQAVMVTKVQPQPFARTITVSGEARPRDDIRVYAPSQGVRITQLIVDEGAYVRQGQPLARLDTRVANAQTRAAEAAVAQAKAAQIRAADEYRRAESIRDSGALSAEQIAARQAASMSAKAQLAAAQAQLAEVNARLEGGYVRAPQSGLVIDRTAQLGQLVSGDSLFRIAGGNKLEVSVEVGESDLLALKPGQKASFRLVDGSDITGVLRRPPASLDSRTRTGDAIFDLPSGGKLRVGMFLRGEARLPSQQMLGAPQDAVVYQDRDAYVFLVGQDNRVKRQKVVLGAREGTYVAIASGLTGGERIVTGGAAFLQDGDIISPIEQRAATEREANLRGKFGG